MVTVDTSATELTLFLAVHTTQLEMVRTTEQIRPSNVMLETNPRGWLPLVFEAAEAADRCVWGCEELGLPVTNRKTDLVLFKVQFTALGYGHFSRYGTLTDRDWKNFRFHGPIPLEGYVSETGSPLLVVDSWMWAIQ